MDTSITSDRVVVHLWFCCALRDYLRHCGGTHSQFSLKIFQILDEITGSLQPDLIIQDKTNLFEINIVSQSTGVVASALKISHSLSSCWHVYMGTNASN